uniref:Uncharacterized protein n=1 Tax=Arundo donax TaxID=35708 RepID=A0A0A9F9H7_ARUDO
MKMMAATIGGPINMDSKIPLIISLMKSHIVCLLKPCRASITKVE